MQAGKRNGIAKATVTRLTGEIPNLKKKVDVAKHTQKACKVVLIGDRTNGKSTQSVL